MRTVKYRQTDGLHMKTVNVTQARADIYNLIASVREGGPVRITSKAGSAVLISETELDEIMETLYLDSIRGMRESVTRGMNVDVKDCRGYESCTGSY
jgi:prevent-host-death family protein